MADEVITADELRRLAAALGADMRAVRKLAAVLGQDIHDLRLLMGAVGSHTDTPISADVVSGTEMYLDPFTVNLNPLSLPLPEAFARLTAVLATHATSEHVIIKVSSHSWEDFYRCLLTAAKLYPEFLDTAQNVQQRFGFASSPALTSPNIAVIHAGEGYAALADWVGRYDQVYSAVLVIRYPAGQLPKEYL